NFYFHLERAMRNIMYLKGDFVERFNHIYKLKETLFVWEHLHLEPYHPGLNDGEDLEESVQELRLCRALLDQAVEAPVSKLIRQRIMEDNDWFEYASNTMNFYYYMARTYIDSEAGKSEVARKDFTEAEESAERLRHQALPIL